MRKGFGVFERPFRRFSDAEKALGPAEENLIVATRQYYALFGSGRINDRRLLTATTIATTRDVRDARNEWMNALGDFARSASGRGGRRSFLDTPDESRHLQRPLQAVAELIDGVREDRRLAIAPVAPITFEPDVPVGPEEVKVALQNELLLFAKDLGPEDVVPVADAVAAVAKAVTNDQFESEDAVMEAYVEQSDLAFSQWEADLGIAPGILPDEPTEL